MFSFTFNRSEPAGTQPQRAKAVVSDATFRRKLDTSPTLRHMCGFDSELYQAITDLGR